MAGHSRTVDPRFGKSGQRGATSGIWAVIIELRTLASALVFWSFPSGPGLAKVGMRHDCSDLQHIVL